MSQIVRQCAGLARSSSDGYAHFVMYRTILTLVFAAILLTSAAAQGRSSDDIKRQIRDLKAEKQFTVTYDQGSDATKLIAVADNLPQRESERAGTQAINFAAAFTFAGKSLVSAPDKIDLTFWVLTKRPQFANDAHWVVTAGGETIDLGNARYVAKPAIDMEYLNFVVSRDDLKMIAVAGAKFRLGKNDFTFTAAQTKLLADLVKLSTP